MKIRYNNKKAFNIKVVNASDSSAKNLEGYEAILHVRADSSSDPVLELTGTVPDPESGVIEFVIEPDDAKITPGTYVFDILIKKGVEGAWEDIRNNETDEFEVLPTVTKIS